MKGEVIEIKVAVGDPVEKGQVVAIISAMKMEMAVQVSSTERLLYIENYGLGQLARFFQLKVFEL